MILHGPTGGAWARRLAPVCLAALVAPMIASAVEDEPNALERRVKAAFLYKFAAYVTWPRPIPPATPFTIAVAGDDNIALELGRIVAGRSVDGRPVSVAIWTPGQTLEGIQVVFVSRQRVDDLEIIVSEARQHATLVVTESEGALSKGSMINFVLSRGRVRFEISLGSASRSGLSLSSRLLGVAQTVRNGTH